MSQKIKTLDCSSITWDATEQGGKAILVSNSPCLKVGQMVQLKKRQSSRVIEGEVTGIVVSNSIRVKTFFWGWYRTKFTYIFQFKVLERELSQVADLTYNKKLCQ